MPQICFLTPGLVFVQVTHSRDTYQDLVRLMEQHRGDRTAQLSILRYADL